MSTPPVRQTQRTASAGIANIIAFVALFLAFALALQITAGLIVVSYRRWINPPSAVTSTQSLASASAASSGLPQLIDPNSILARGSARAVLMTIIFAAGVAALAYGRLHNSTMARIFAWLNAGLAFLLTAWGAFKFNLSNQITAEEWFGIVLLAGLLLAYAVVLTFFSDRPQDCRLFAIAGALVVIGDALLLVAQLSLSLNAVFVASLGFLLVILLFVGAMLYASMMLTALKAGQR